MSPDQAEALRQLCARAAALLDASEALSRAIEANFRQADRLRRDLEAGSSLAPCPELLRAQGALRALLEQAHTHARVQEGCLDRLGGRVH